MSYIKWINFGFYNVWVLVLQLGFLHIVLIQYSYKHSLWTDARKHSYRGSHLLQKLDSFYNNWIRSDYNPCVGEIKYILYIFICLTKNYFLWTLSTMGEGSDQFHAFWGDFVKYMETRRYGSLWLPTSSSCRGLGRLFRPPAKWGDIYFKNEVFPSPIRKIHWHMTDILCQNLTTGTP